MAINEKKQQTKNKRRRCRTFFEEGMRKPGAVEGNEMLQLETIQEESSPDNTVLDEPSKLQSEIDSLKGVELSMRAELELMKINHLEVSTTKDDIYKKLQRSTYFYYGDDHDRNSSSSTCSKSPSILSVLKEELKRVADEEAGLFQLSSLSSAELVDESSNHNNRVHKNQAKTDENDVGMKSFINGRLEKENVELQKRVTLLEEARKSQAAAWRARENQLLSILGEANVELKKRIADEEAATKKSTPPDTQPTNDLEKEVSESFQSTSMRHMSTLKLRLLNLDKKCREERIQSVRLSRASYGKDVERLQMIERLRQRTEALENRNQELEEVIIELRLKLANNYSQSGSYHDAVSSENMTSPATVDSSSTKVSQLRSKVALARARVSSVRANLRPINNSSEYRSSMHQKITEPKDQPLLESMVETLAHFLQPPLVWSVTELEAPSHSGPPATIEIKTSTSSELALSVSPTAEVEETAVVEGRIKAIEAIEVEGSTHENIIFSSHCFHNRQSDPVRMPPKLIVTPNTFPGGSPDFLQEEIATFIGSRTAKKLAISGIVPSQRSDDVCRKDTRDDGESIELLNTLSDDTINWRFVDI